MELTRQDFEMLEKALSLGQYGFSTHREMPPNFHEMHKEGYFDREVMGAGTSYIAVEITEKGKDLLRNTIIVAVQVNVPRQPPLILRDGKALADDILAGILEESFGLLATDYQDGEEVFSISAKRISLYDLATLPEWDPT